MRTIIPNETPVKEMHQYLLGTVSPRPIAFVSTVNEEGQPNLAPYSFFNVFSSNPPIAVFSSNRRVSDNTTKDTLHNVKVTGECVINAVTYDIVRQMTVASVGYSSEVNEFDKAGLTPISSDLVKPFRVKESPAHMECKVREIIPLDHELNFATAVHQTDKCNLPHDTLGQHSPGNPVKLLLRFQLFAILVGKLCMQLRCSYVGREIIRKCIPLLA